MFKGLMKQNAKHAKILAENSKGVEEIINLLSKRGKNSGESSTARNCDRKTQGTSSSTTPKITKLDFARYNGEEDPTSWICRVE